VLQRVDGDLAAAGVGSLRDYDVLYTLYRAPNRRLRLAELSDAAILSRSGLTRLVDRLEARGLLRREPCAKDRRGAYAVLTDEGLEEMRRIWAIYGRGIAEYFAAHLSAEETETTQRAFARIADILRADNRDREPADS
jgi:DNA-binding MarR family transcriptional regulator